MDIKLSQPFARDSAAEDSDVRRMKKALNRLGYYLPYEKTGITGIPDAGVFAALTSFQKDRGLTPTGAAKPGDDTVRALSRAFAENKNGKYIWRTVGDDKVRAEHAALNGTARDFSDSPDPGEEFNCRCWAEPVDEAAGLSQVVISPIKNSGKQWTNLDFVMHFYFGGGKEKTLSEIGWFGPVVEHAKQIMFDNVLQQVAGRAKSVQNGTFTGSWNNSYSFGSVIFSIGGAVIRGRFGGTVKKEDKILVIEAKAEYEFSDTFTDPLNKRQRKIGSSAIEDIPYDFSRPWWSPGNLGAAYFAADTEYMGTPYEITGEWTTKIRGSISAEE